MEKKYRVTSKYANNYGLNSFDPLKNVMYTTIELNVEPEKLTKDEILEIEGKFLKEIAYSKRERDEAEKIYYAKEEPAYFEIAESYYEETEAAYNIELNELWNLNSQFLKNKEFMMYLEENFKDAYLVNSEDRPYVKNERGENDLNWHQEITSDLKIVTNDSKEFVFNIPDEGNKVLEELLEKFDYKVVKKENYYDKIKSVAPPGKEQVITNSMEQKR